MCQLKRNQTTQTSVLLRTVQKRYLNHSNREISSLQVEKNKLDKPFTILSRDCKTPGLKRIQNFPVVSKEGMMPEILKARYRWGFFCCCRATLQPWQLLSPRCFQHHLLHHLWGSVWLWGQEISNFNWVDKWKQQASELYTNTGVYGFI